MFPKSSSIIDSNGNINDSVLVHELQDSLASDIKYKQVDNMKKRAVKVASDYNEFKAMVACAHLKKISSEEVATLSNVKKGWKKSHSTDKATSAQLLTKDNTSSHLLGRTGNNKSVSKSSSSGLPRTSMELERDLRRQPSQEDKLRYLFQMDANGASNLLQTADTDILEQILEIVSVAFHNDASHGEILQSVSNVDDISLDRTKLVDWLTVLSKCHKFTLLLHFAPAKLVSDVICFLQRLQAIDIVNSEQLMGLQSKYTVN